MQNSKIQVALIGCGMIGHGHAEAIQADGRAEIAALAYGRNADKGRAFADEFKIPFITNDYHDIIKRGGIDMVIICTPSSLHAPCAIDFANAGVHILCEKPLDISDETVTAMIDAAEKNGVLLGCVFPNRAQEGLQKAKALIDSGKLGKMRMVEFQYRGYRSHAYYSESYWKGTKKYDGGGCLINQGIHGIDAMLYLTGDVRSVCAVTDTMGRDIEVEDAACALLEFENGAHGSLMGTTLSYFPEKNSECERVRIELEKGTIVFADGKTIYYKSLSDDKLETEAISLSAKVEDFGANPEDIDMSAHFALVSNFIDGVISGTKLFAPARDARRSVDLVLAIYKSSKSRTWENVNHKPW